MRFHHQVCDDPNGMALRDTLREVQIAALRAKDQLRLSVVRMVLSAVKHEEIARGSSLDDAAIREVIARQVKQLRDAGQDFERAGRTDLLEQNDREIEILQAFLPPQLSDDELMMVVRRVLVEAQCVRPSDMGRAMGAVIKVIQGQADGARVRTVVERVLAGE